MNLILDIDQTLIGYNMEELQKSTASTFVYPRPYLEMFLQYCFEHSQNVGLWSAAEPYFMQLVIERVLQPIVSHLNEKYTFSWKFDPILTRNECSLIIYDGVPTKLLYKDLRAVYRILPTANNKNTLIIDDNRDTCNFNPMNSMLVNPYVVSAADNTTDDELLKLIYRLKVVFRIYNIKKDIPYAISALSGE